MNTLLAWLTEGGIPVSQPLAEHRASICVACPENRAPNWWEIHKDKIALAIRSMLAVKNDAGYKVRQELQLAMCRICGCANRLSVWTPIDHFRGKINVADYPAPCWKRTEISN